MKILCWYAVAALAMTAAGGWAVAPGDSREAVFAELGQPTGLIQTTDGELLYFARGSVELRAGKVVKADLVSEEALRQRRQAEAAARAQRAKGDVVRRAQLKAEGEAVMKQWLADPDFLTADPEVQVARWQDFMRRYPDVPAAGHLVAAQKRLEARQAGQAHDRKLAELESRTQQAEQRAAAAEQAAQRARSRSDYSVWPDGSYTWYAPTPLNAYYYPPLGAPVLVSPPAGAPRGSNFSTSPYPGPQGPHSWPYDFSSKMNPPADRRGEAAHPPRSALANP